MIIQLVAFNVSSTWKKRLEMTTEIFNNSNADLILFSGHTLLNLKYVRALKKSITNNHTRAILEIKDYERNSFMELSNSLFYIHDGIIEDMFSSQIFASSKEIKNDSMLAERLLKEMPERRKIIIDGIRFSILQCGEINIIANRQKDQNKPYFRFEDEPNMASMFDEVEKTTDVFLNPIHTPMGNINKMRKKKALLSKDGRYYFSTNNFGKSNGQKKVTPITSTNIHYAYYDGKELQQFMGSHEGVLAEKILGKDSSEKWSDLWYIYKPAGYDKTLAEMTESERNNRKKYKSVSSMEVFAKWYKENNKE